MAGTPGPNKPIFAPDRLAVGIAGTLVVLAALAWLASYYLMPFMTMSGGSGAMASSVAGIVSSLSLTSVGIFEIVWVIGMAAMMFPAMMPVVLFYSKVATRQEPNQRLARMVGTPLFLSGYLVTYALLGLGAYFAIYEALNLSMSLPSNLLLLSILAPSAVLVTTGIYQFTPLKYRCLSNCVSPLGFFAVHYKSGMSGSMRMGFRHGIYCVGCCWAFMLVMLGVGAMSIPVMAVLAGIIALEKVVVRGSIWFSRLVGLGFVVMGVLVVLIPGLLFAL